MEHMTVFFTEILNSVSVFLASEPVIYLFGLVCLLFVVKAFKDILTGVS